MTNRYQSLFNSRVVDTVSVGPYLKVSRDGENVIFNSVLGSSCSSSVMANRGYKSSSVALTKAACGELFSRMMIAISGDAYWTMKESDNPLDQKLVTVGGCVQGYVDLVTGSTKIYVFHTNSYQFHGNFMEKLVVNTSYLARAGDCSGYSFGDGMHEFFYKRLRQYGFNMMYLNDACSAVCMKGVYKYLVDFAVNGFELSVTGSRVCAY